MRLVDNNVFKTGENLVFQFDILQQQSVIGNNQHTVFALLAVFHVITVAKPAALPAKTGFCLACNGSPVLMLQFIKIESFFIAVLCKAEPVY